MSTPSYRRHSQRDFAFVEWKGKRHKLPGRFNSDESLAAYHKFLHDHVYAATKVAPLPIPPPGTSLSIAGVVARYLDHAKAYYPNGRNSEYANMRNAVSTTNIVGRHGREAAEEFGPLKLKSMQSTLAGDGHSRNYVNSVVNRIKRIFKWAASEELIPAATWQWLATVQGLKKGRSEAREPKAKRKVNMSEVAAVAAAVNRVVRAMLWLQAFTGARSGSICMATPEQFDREIEGGLWLWKPRHKTEHIDATVILPIGPKCQAELLPFIDREPTAFMFSPREVGKGLNRRYRKRYDSGSYRQAILRGQAKAGVEVWTPHQLRHARGEEIRNRYGVEAAQAVLGHATLEATQIYTERQLELAMQVARETG